MDKEKILKSFGITKETRFHDYNYLFNSILLAMDKYKQTEVECVIPDVNNTKCTLDLRELEKRLDDSLDKENSETLKKWINSQRQ